MTIQKKSLISTLNTTKKAIVASSQAGTVSVEPATKSPARRLAASKSPARKQPTVRSFATKR